MSEQKLNYGWDYFEDVYENTLKKGQTFSNEMGEVIRQELEKMYKEREEWLNNKQQKGEENDTRTISESEANQ